MKSFEPDLRQTLESLIENFVNKYHFTKVVKINSVNFNKRTAMVSIVNKYQSKKGETYEYPLIEATIQLTYTNQSGLKMPIPVNSYGILLFNDDSLDEWLLNGYINLPKNKRKKSLNDAIVIPSIFPICQSGNDYSNDFCELFYQNSSIKLKDKITIKNNETDVKTLLENFIENYNTSVKNALIQLVITALGIPCTIDASVANTTLDTAKNNIKTEIEKLFIS